MLAGFHRVYDEALFIFQGSCRHCPCICRILIRVGSIGGAKGLGP